jgi:hypothetical protein
MKIFITYFAIGFLGGIPLAFMPLRMATSVDYVEGYYEGFDDAQALFAEAMVRIDDREAAEGISLSKEAYRAVLRAAVGHVDARSSRRIKKMLEEE